MLLVITFIYLPPSRRYSMTALGSPTSPELPPILSRRSILVLIFVTVGSTDLDSKSWIMSNRCTKPAAKIWDVCSCMKSCHTTLRCAMSCACSVMRQQTCLLCVCVGLRCKQRHETAEMCVAVVRCSVQTVQRISRVACGVCRACCNGQDIHAMKNRCYHVKQTHKGCCKDVGCLHLHHKLICTTA